jgi:hypothetical protein
MMSDLDISDSSGRLDPTHPPALMYLYFTAFRRSALERSLEDHKNDWTRHFAPRSRNRLLASAMIEWTARTVASDQLSALVTQGVTGPREIVVAPGLQYLVQAEIMIIVLLTLEQLRYFLCS